MSAGRVTRRLIVGNWKMNLGEAEARTLVRAIAASFPFDRVDGAVAPAFPCLRAALDAATGTALSIGAQNVHPDDRGAFTGEVSAPMLASMSVRYVIVGHSERRTLFGETDALVARKLLAVARHGMAPILCVGETESERERGASHDVVVGQLRAALSGFVPGPGVELAVAYEPVWAIGTGRTPSPGDVAAVHGTIRAELVARLGGAGAGVRILYGGSATAANAAALLTAHDVSGALVGGASLDAASFLAIGHAAA